MTKLVSKGTLKAKMLEYFREIEKSGEELIVTDNRVPVLRIIPLQRSKKSVDEVFSSLRSVHLSVAELVSPTVEEWSET
jgi:antitoxin (DNA-binding transcriptional repressor) of toxin-antitoxin stability system